MGAGDQSKSDLSLLFFLIFWKSICSNLRFCLITKKGIIHHMITFIRSFKCIPHLTIRVHWYINPPCDILLYYYCHPHKNHYYYTHTNSWCSNKKLHHIFCNKFTDGINLLNDSIFFSCYLLGMNKLLPS